MINASHPNGHFYSPVVDPAELTSRVDELWPDQPEVVGIDFNDAGHEYILGEVFSRHIGAYDYPEILPETPELTEFFTRNSQFSWLDSRALFVLLREWRPRRLIEIGSGFSSLLIADVNRRFLGNSLEVTCVEPYPRPFLHDGLPGISHLLQAKVQDVALDTFTALEAGDVLFIDSSHVAKTGSDVNYLYFEVLPRLRPGVRVHIHDIFVPHEYPKDWVLDENRSWNEQYLLRALLMHSTAFRVLFGSYYANFRFPDLVRRALAHPRGHAFGGGSFWIERLR
jgi:predicted O-methyltransferase YrrM